MQTLCDKEEVVYAGFFCRVAAFFLDQVLVGFGLMFVKLVVWVIKLVAGDTMLFQPVLFQYNIFDILYYLLTSAYFVLMTYCCGSTVGKLMMRIKVVDSQGGKLTFLNVLIRETIGKYLSAVIIYIGYIIAGCDNRKQGLHDKIADTCVVYQHKVRVRAATPMPMQPVVVGTTTETTGWTERGEGADVQMPAQNADLTQE